MPQIQVLQCPSCGASISYEGGADPTVTCQFCGSNVIVPDELREQPATPSPAFEVAGLSLDKLAELKRLARSGQKIQAIKLYRQMFDVGLKEAKDAVDKLEAGEPLVVTSVSALSSNATLSASSGVPAEQAARLAQVIQRLRAGQKIEAIKLYRGLTGLGLKEAKAAVEAIEMGLGGVGQPVRVPMEQARRAGRTAGCVSKGISILAVVGIIGFVLAMVFGLPFRLSGSYRQALEAARTHPAVIESLGAPVEASWWPILGELSCGSTSCSANYEIPIHGARASGHLQVMSDSKGAALFNEGTWTLDAMVRMDDGSTVRLRAPTPAPTPSAAQLQATAQAVTRATAQADRDAQATATRQSATATAEAKSTAQAVQRATATAQAQAIAQSILATQSPWPVALAESFADNRRGWPVGVQGDRFISITSVMTGNQYLWTVNPKQGNSYWNVLPTNGKTFADFHAAVNLRFAQGSDEGSYAYGLVFRRVGDDYGFFGLQNNGKFRLLVVFHTGIYQDITQSAPSIRTQPGQVNRIAVRAMGPDFIFLINDQVVWQLNEELAPGEIGLGVDVRAKRDEAQVEFTDLQVRAP